MIAQGLNILPIVSGIILWGIIVVWNRREASRPLRSPELGLLLAVLILTGYAVSQFLLPAFGFGISPIPAAVVQLVIGMIWIRAKRDYAANVNRDALSFGESARPEPSDDPARSSSAKSTAVSPLIFLSYRRGSSSDVTGRIYDRLVQHFGQGCVFKDVDSIPLGVDFRKHLTDSVGKCQLLLAVIGQEWAANSKRESKAGVEDPRDFVRIEIESALQRDIPVIPVLVQGASIPQETELPTSLHALAYHNAIAVRPDPDFHSDMTRLIKGIEHHLAKPQRE